MNNNHPTETRTIKDFLSIVGEIAIFSGKFFQRMFRRPFELEEILRQMFMLGVKSIFIISITIFIIGLVITIQLGPRMEELGAVSLIPNMLAVSIIKEVGPVLTALICAGKLGSGIAAEIGAMKVTQQIDAMSVSGADDYKYLVFTRVMATTLILPVLTIYSFMVGMIGAYVGFNMEHDISVPLFITSAFATLHVNDLVPAIIKPVFFGFSIANISCFFGYKTGKGAAAVGHAANTAIVYSFLVIFFIDLMAAQVSHLIFD
jgi:phospholipid/cholesterol/gamma-HCH transport system permease protein